MRGKALAILASVLGTGAVLCFLLPGAEPPITAVPPAPRINATVPAPALDPVILRDESGEMVVVDPLRLDDCVLRGRAMNPDGSPWRGLVALVGDFLEGEPPAAVATASDGTFRFENLPAKRVRIVARRGEDLVTPGPLVLLPIEEEVPFVVGAGLLEVRGRVTAAADGSPVAGASVTLDGEDSEDPVFDRTESDADGRFLVRVPDDIGGLLGVEAEGFLFESEELQPGRRATDPPLEIRLQRTATIEGRVLEDGTDRPLHGIRVFAEDASAASDTWGRFTLEGVRPGQGFLYAMGDGWVPKEIATAEGWLRNPFSVVVPESGGLRRDFLMVPAVRIVGRVLDSRGEPAAGIELKAWSRIPGAEGHGYGIRIREPLGSVLTRADGGFEYRTGLPGVVVRFLAKDKRTPVAAAEAAPAAPGETVDVTLRIPEERTVTVRVVDEETGEPRPGVPVMAALRVFPGESLGLDRSPATGPDGTAVVGPVPAFPLVVSAWAAEATVEPGATETVTLRIPPPAAEEPEPAAEGALSISGVVVFPDGRPAAEATWDCLPVDDHWMRCFYTPPVTDFRGRFRMEGLLPGKFRVTADCVREGRTWTAEAVLDAGTTDAVLRLGDERRIGARLDDPECPIRLRILDPDGKPIPGGSATAHYVAADGSEESMESKVFEGESAFPNLEIPAERVWFEVCGAEDGAGRPLPFAHGLFGPFPPGAGRHEVRLSPGCAVEGRIVDSEGNGIGEAAVSLALAPGSVPGGPSSPASALDPARSDGEGRFRIDGCGDLPYLLSVEPHPGYSVPPPVPVRGGARDVVVALRGSISPIVTVLGPDGTPVSGALVKASPLGDDAVARSGDGRTGPSGVLRLVGLDPLALYELRAEPPRERDDLLPHTATDWNPADTRVRLEKGRVFEVSVRDPDGRPIEGMYVSLQGEIAPGRTFGGGETTDPEGIARFLRLPKGTAQVTAEIRGPGGRVLAEASVEVSVEAGRATLVIDPGGDAVLRMKGWDRDWVGIAYFAGEDDAEPAQAGVGNDGTVRLRGLAPGKAYNVYVRQWEVEHGEDRYPRCFLLRGVRAGDPPREVELVEGRHITGKAILPEGAEGFAVAALLGKTVLFDGIPEEDGSFRIPAMPEGTWTVVVYLTTPDGKYHASTGVAPAGGSVEIRVP